MRKSEIEYWDMKGTSGWTFQFVHRNADGMSFNSACGKIDIGKRDFVCGYDYNEENKRLDLMRVMDAENRGHYNLDNYKMVLGILHWMEGMKIDRSMSAKWFKGLSDFYRGYSVFRYAYPFWFDGLHRVIDDFEDGVEYFGKVGDYAISVENMFGQKIFMVLDCFEPVR